MYFRAIYKLFYLNFYNVLELFDEELGDDDVFVLESIAEATQRKDDKLRVTLVFTLKDTMTSLAKIIKIIEVTLHVFVSIEKSLRSLR